MSSNMDSSHDTHYEQNRTGSSSAINVADSNAAEEGDTRNEADTVSPLLPEIKPSADLGLDLSDIFGSGSSTGNNAELEKVQKRASNVQKLAMENEKLKAELKAMSDRLEAAERRREELSQKKQMIREPPSD
ncbi:hypothetical protein Moror_8946 [Moniliophthora roreri MCA 2997]|uniref:Uncharacterized protein n=2 Tax=Moniliophthora roreri TaxID=221103 RepID=V2X1P9_MONRO|nr:hypothetical protein Moror_8946 [Moniliophthora roreri MCA 2997]